MAETMGFCQPEWNFDSLVDESNEILFNVCFKRPFRWKFVIPSICSDGISTLPPSKTARPSLSFKEMTVEHLNESISFPTKPEWKPVQLTVYDIVKKDEDGNSIENPIFTWLRLQYDPKPGETDALMLLNGCSYWRPCLETPSFKAPNVSLLLLDGCGETIEEWVYEMVYPNNIEFGELNYGEINVLTVDVTLRYDRAYIVDPAIPAPIAFPEFTYSCDPIPFMEQEEDIIEFKVRRFR